MTSPHRPKVLHVDDSRTARHLIRVILHEAGFEVVEAGTGKEALALAAPGGCQPRLILLDINLPDMSGLEVCRKLRADPTTAAIPIVHLSGERIEAEDQVSGLEGGADGYLTQPVEPSVLVAYLKALLRTRRAEAELREHRDHLEELVRERAAELAAANEQSVREAALAQQAEEAEGRKTQDIDYLSRTALEFAAFPPEGDIYEHIAKRLKGLVGDSIIFVDSFDESSGLVEVRHMLGLGKFTSAALKLIGRSPVGMRFPLLEELGGLFRKGGLVNLEKGIYELAQGQIPERVCKALEKLVGIGEIYSLGFAREGRLFAHASILTRQGAELKYRVVIETFANQASVALQRRLAEQRERARARDLEYLSRTALEFAALPPEGDIYEHIASRLKEIVGEAVVFVNSFDEGSGLIECRSVVGLGKFSRRVLKLIGKSPVGMRFPLSEEADRELKTGRLAKVPGGLHSLALGQIPEKACTALEKLLGVKGIYAIGIARKGTLFANASMVMREGAESPDATLVEAFANQASVALQRKLAEEDLRSSEERLRILFERAPDAYYLNDLKGVFVDGNRAAEELTGYSKEDLIGKSFLKLKLLSASQMPKAAALLARNVLGRPTGPDEFALRRRDGRSVHVEIRTFPVKIGARSLVLGIARDITQRRRAEEELRESEEKFRSVIENAPMGMHMYELAADGTLRFTGANPAADRILGVDNSRYVGKTMDEAFPAIVETDIPERFREIAEKGGFWHKEDIEYGDERIAGAFENFNFRVSPGKMVSMFLDITDRKRAEEELRENEERYRALVSDIPGAVYRAECNPEKWTIDFFSDHIVDILGYPASDFIGDKVRTYASVIHPDDAPMVDETVLDCVGKHVPFGLEYRVLCADGSVRWVHDRGQGVFGEGGELQWLDGVVHDVTDRKRAEEELRERAKELDCLYQSSRLMAEPDKPLHEIIRAVADLIPPAWRYPDVACARIIFEGEEFKTGSFAETLWKQSAEIMVLGQTAGSVEVCYLEERPEAHEGPFFDEERELIDTLAQEIGKFAERKRAERALHETEEQFRQSQKLEAVGRLAGGIAHDFNNMLGAIIGYGDVILTSLKEADPIRRDLEQIKSAADRAAALTRQLLAFSRKQTLQPKVMDLNDGVTSLEKMLRRLIGEDIELATVLADDLGRVKADPGQIDQVIMNLAVNSRDAMPGGGKLTIETGNVELDKEYARTHVAVTPGPHVMLAITDTGCGMDEETQSKIFEPFFTTKETGKGTGLGLSMVYGIVKQSGGNVWVYSEPGKGTTFKVYLPRIEEAVEATERRRPAAAGARGSETILVVEDEEVLRRLITRILSLSGYKVLEARNGGEALLLCEQHEGPIHLMLTDVVMPQMGGRKLAERVASLRPEMKVAYMSGYTDDAIVRNGELSADMPFIQKPFTASALARTVRETLDSRGMPSSERE